MLDFPDTLLHIQVLLMNSYSNTVHVCIASQEALGDGVTLDEDARSTIDDLVAEPVVLDVLHHRVVLCARLEPQRRDGERLGLLEDTECHLRITVEDYQDWNQHDCRVQRWDYTFGGVMMLTEVSVGAGRSAS